MRRWSSTGYLASDAWASPEAAHTHSLSFFTLGVITMATQRLFQALILVAAAGVIMMAPADTYASNRHNGCEDSIASANSDLLAAAKRVRSSRGTAPLQQCGVCTKLNYCPNQQDRDALCCIICDEPLTAGVCETGDPPSGCDPGDKRAWWCS
jgi:hypothetical protein